MYNRHHRGHQQADRFMGYIGMFLIGAISWAGDHLRQGQDPAQVAQTDDQKDYQKFAEENNS